MNQRNPYKIDRYAPAAHPAGIARAGTQLTGMVLCVLVMAALCLGTIWVMWRASGK